MARNNKIRGTLRIPSITLIGLELVYVLVLLVMEGSEALASCFCLSQNCYGKERYSYCNEHLSTNSRLEGCVSSAVCMWKDFCLLQTVSRNKSTLVIEKEI